MPFSSVYIYNKIIEYVGRFFDDGLFQLLIVYFLIDDDYFNCES